MFVAFVLGLCLLPGCAPETPDTPEPAGSQVSATRVVSLVPSFTEAIVALGAADRLVAIGNYDPEVPGRPDLPRIGDATSVNLETLLAVKPDLVLVNADALEAAVAPLRSRLRIVRLTNDRLADALSALERVAELVGRPDEGRALRKSIDASIAAARKRAAERAAVGDAPPRVLVVLQRRPLYTVGATSYLHDLLTAVGAENVTGDLQDAWPTLGEEALLARAPDVILDASVEDAEADLSQAELLERWAHFETLPAVRLGRIHVVRQDSLFRAGTRTPEALAVLERVLFPSVGAEMKDSK